MVGLKNVNKKIKMKLNDYDISTKNEPDKEISSNQAIKKSSNQAIKKPKPQKIQTTIYLTSEIDDMLFELQRFFRRQGEKKDRSQILCDAIELLHKKLIR